MTNIDKTVETFNLSRKLFAIKDGEVFVKNIYTTQGHKEWFESMGWFENETEEETFNKVIRGYVDEEGLYIYKGNDFDVTKEDVLNTLPYLVDLQTLLDFSERLPVYAGVISGELGTKFKPKRYIGSLATITTLNVIVWSD